MTAARIAVLMPAYKAEKTIQKALDSLKANAEPHDVIVVDDGSPVLLRDVLPPQPNITILRPDHNLGVTGATNFGLRYILDRSYEFIARLDSDDAVSADRLMLQRQFLDAHPDVVMVGGRGRVFSEEGEYLFAINCPLDHADILRASFYNSGFIHPAIMVRADAVRKIGVYSEEYPSAEDYEFTRRLSQSGHVANLPDYVIDYTISQGGISQSRRRSQLLSRLKVQWAYRDFGTPHFYLGMLKTLALLMTPVALIAWIKGRHKAYRTASSSGDGA